MCQSIIAQYLVADDIARNVSWNVDYKLQSEEIYLEIFIVEYKFIHNVCSAIQYLHFEPIWKSLCQFWVVM